MCRTLDRSQSTIGTWSGTRLLLTNGYRPVVSGENRIDLQVIEPWAISPEVEGAASLIEIRIVNRKNGAVSVKEVHGHADQVGKISLP